MTVTAMQKPIDLPDSWQITTIGDITEKFLNGGTPPTKNSEYWEGNIPWTTSSPMTSFYLDRGEYTISKEGLEKSASNLIPKNNILISTRVGVGKVAINRIDVAINQDLTGLILDKKRITPEFFVWLLLSKKYNQKLKGMSRGTTIKGLIRSELERFTIPLPPLPEQRRIATILITSDDAIQRSRQAAAETERLKAGVMQELMTKGIGHIEFREDPDIGIVPKEWAVKPLDELIEIVDCRHHTPTYIESGYPVVRPQNIKTDGIDFSNCANISRQEYLLMTERHTPKNGDIVYSRNASFGVPAFVETDTEFCIGQDMVVMTKLTANTKYIFYVLCSGSIQRQLKQLSGGSTIQRINLKDIRRLLIPEPELKEQQQIAIILSTIDRKRSFQHERTAHYEHLRQGLMNELLTGKRRVKVM
jgi:type I restriction enzyme S subunit